MPPLRLALMIIFVAVCAAAQSADDSAKEATECDGISAAACWHKVDADPFSISAPSGWKFHQLSGVDSYVGEFVGVDVVLTFDFGRYSTELRNVKKTAYIITKKRIGGRSARVVRPHTPGKGMTGVYVRVGGHNALCLWGKDLTSEQEELVLKIFETIRFGGPTPPSLIPPPPPPPASKAD